MSILDLASDKIIDKYSKRKSSFYSYYPMNGLWKEEKGQESYVEAIRDLKKKNPSSAINIYIHFPFCETQCLFCHCFTIISKDCSVKASVSLTLNVTTPEVLSP